jgi:signal transduction histidine kinase
LSAPQTVREPIRAFFRSLLGLSISYDIVTQQHGGTIEVDSEPGEFTEFTITLPRNGQATGRSA